MYENNEDIYKRITTYEETINDDGSITKRPKVKFVNLTKKINETAKLMKIETINEKSEQIKEMLTNE